MSPQSVEHIPGRNPVFEVLRAGRRNVRELLIAPGGESRRGLADLLQSAEESGHAIRTVPRRELDQLAAHHGGVIAVVEPYPYANLEEIVAGERSGPDEPLVLLLDTLQDPQNMGTLIRTAEAVGVEGVIIPHRRAVGVTPAVVSASSGACEHLRIARSNLAGAIRRLKEAGFWIAGLEASEQAQPLQAFDPKGPLGLVVGSEGSGMRRLVRESCDFLLRLPMRGQVASLNASVAGSVALYAIWRARGYPGG
jgi:23S rRNA (guanosine2251-2'-O)-methyltransferase